MCLLVGLVGLTALLLAWQVSAPRRAIGAGTEIERLSALPTSLEASVGACELEDEEEEFGGVEQFGLSGSLIVRPAPLIIPGSTRPGSISSYPFIPAHQPLRC